LNGGENREMKIIFLKDAEDLSMKQEAGNIQAEERGGWFS